ncbi:DoxX family protein [Kibdelosporangium philippinense]|uniref:DoxX family protein n=1 Tax=Kibdelosporangium philippinense TaxID=211113 RepID=A0ABS8ZT75_9PSEU|nr:DoxX family protein [Kibdelosporangium philippinense]MCE7010896.1 DoxX family protein [Kibdelosporangium philippinense]
MNIALWVVQGILAVAFLIAGGTKLALSNQRLLERGPAMAWVGDFSQRSVKTIGTLEVLGALSLVIPPALDFATVLTPTAATGFVLLMFGATIVHLRRGETVAIGLPILLGVLALVVVFLRALAL